jgi:hypothetical protein
MLLEVLALKGAPLALKALAPHLSALWHTYGLHGTAKLAYDASIATGIYKQLVEDSQAFVKAVKGKDLSKALFHSKNLLNFATDLPSVHSLTKELGDYLAAPRVQKKQLKQLSHLGQDILDASSSVSSTFKEISGFHEGELVEDHKSLKQSDLNRKDHPSDVEKISHNDNLSSVHKIKHPQQKNLAVGESEIAKHSLHEEPLIKARAELQSEITASDEIGTMQNSISVDQESQLLRESYLRADSNETLLEKNFDSLNLELQPEHSLQLELESGLLAKDVSKLFPEEELQLGDGKLLLEDGTNFNPELQVNYPSDIETVAKLSEATANVPGTVGFLKP